MHAFVFCVCRFRFIGVWHQESGKGPRLAKAAASHWNGAVVIVVIVGIVGIVVAVRAIEMSSSAAAAVVMALWRR